MIKIMRKFIVFLVLLLGSFTIEKAFVFAKENTGVKSEVEIFYSENQDITPTYHPAIPKEPVEIISPMPVNPGTAGPLSVDFAPNIVFGEHKASDKDDIYYAKLTKVKKVVDGAENEVPNYLQITDNRGKKEGWRLTVRQNGQLSNRTHDLNGAEISIKNITLISPNSSAKPIAANDIRLDPIKQEAAELSRSDEQTGKGTWIIMFGANNEESKKSIQVNVPGTTEKQKGNYTTSLTWELIDSPI
ncbi:WxL domain-containing protein [Enterococcus rotai]|uniref:WxL domain-containing protein n=1 Tax=Enterococcus rotai TaxID=118060 RepID=UPI0032B406D5